MNTEIKKEFTECYTAEEKILCLCGALFNGKQVLVSFKHDKKTVLGEIVEIVPHFSVGYENIEECKFYVAEVNSMREYKLNIEELLSVEIVDEEDEDNE